MTFLAALYKTTSFLFILKLLGVHSTRAQDRQTECGSFGSFIDYALRGRPSSPSRPLDPPLQSCDWT